tara:strand:- start:435 stop:767 length:333 start_codon:yes stop_codon:yes gene_type:complete
MNSKESQLIFDAYTQDLIQNFELNVHWVNKYGGTTGIIDHTWRSAKEPTEEDIKAWIIDNWEGNDILSHADKANIPDPMDFTFRVLGTYSPDEDRGAVGFKTGGRPLRGG